MESIARHAAGAVRSRTRTVLKVIAAGVAVSLVSGLSVAAIAGYSIAQRIDANAVDISGADAPPAIGEFEGAFNVLIVVADNDESQGQRYGDRDATLNDANLLLHVSADHRSAVAISMPRDLVIAHPECTGPDGTTYPEQRAAALNTAMARGGLGCVTETVRSLTGLPINHAGLVTFDAIIEMTEAIDGVEVCLSSRLYDPFVASPTTGEILDLPAGRYDIKGEDALGYLRSRHAVGDGGDLARVSSQQQFLSSMMRKVKSDETLTNVPRLLSLAGVVADTVQLSTSLVNTTTMISMAQALRTVDLENIVFVQYPAAYDDRFPGKVVPVEDKAAELFALIEADQPFALGEDSQGVGVADAPEDVADAPADPVEESPAADPSADPSAAPSADPSAPAVLDGVPGQTANDQTCTAVKE